MFKKIDFHFIKDNKLSFEKASTLEWLETNSQGSYSSSTITNNHTRKYHGLLVSNLSFPYAAGKYVLLSKLEDWIEYNHQKYFLSSSQYPNYLQNGGFVWLKEFINDTHPCFIYQFDDLVVIKEILFLPNTETLLLKYKILSETQNPKVTLKIKPLLAYRNFHELAKENSVIQSEMVACKWGKVIRPYDRMPPLFIQFSENHDFSSTPSWYHNFEYLMEQQRGFDYLEDLFAPATFELPFAKEIVMSFALQETQEDLEQKWHAEVNRRQESIVNLSVVDDLQKQLLFVAQSFIQRSKDSPIIKRNQKINQAEGIVAGYHWFGCWGRDTMISLPGLALYSSPNGQEDYLDILKAYASFEMNGLLPNFIGIDGKNNAYNAVDVSLWFIWAIQQYYLNTKGLQIIVKNFWPNIKSIFAHYKNGTSFSIKMADNGILYAGDETTNLTWMDAMVDNKPVIPRFGAQVEVNALWYNALNFIAEVAEEINDPIANEIKPIIKSLKTTFREIFWSEKLGYLLDFVNEREQNCAIRPNQILAISLPYSPLPRNIAIKVLETVKEHLLTPYGLRTLSPRDPNYIGHYAGDAKERDRAYHNGTVWPWLLGHFAEALNKLTTYPKFKKVIEPCLQAMLKHLHEAGVGTISEVFDGDYPHHPNGCISQAWSVAEILRISLMLN